MMLLFKCFFLSRKTILALIALIFEEFKLTYQLT